MAGRNLFATDPQQVQTPAPVPPAVQPAAGRNLLGGQPQPAPAPAPAPGANLLPTQRRETVDEELRRLLQEQAAETGPVEAGFVAMGSGLTKLGRAIGLVDPADETEKAAMAALSEEYPIATGVGEAVGQALPFAPAGVGLSAIRAVLPRVLAATGLGVTEGGLIAKSQGGDVVSGAGIGGTIAGTAEALFPIIGRVGGRLIRKVTGKTPKGAVLDATGAPTPELKAALDDSGFSFEELTAEAVEQLKQTAPGADPAQAARAARLEALGAPATRGDVTQEFAQQAQEARLLEAAADPMGDPMRALRLQQSQAFRARLDEQIDSLGVADDVGDTLKEALSGRKKMLTAEKNALYKQVAETSDNIKNTPILTDSIADAMPADREIRRLSRISGNQAPAVDDLMIEFGINTDPAKVEKFLDAGGEIIPLNIGNFDEFRQALNQIEKADISGSTSVIIGPIRNALDNEADLIDDALRGVVATAPSPQKVVDGLKAIKASAKAQGVKISTTVSGKNKTIVLDQIVVPENMRDAGIGSKLMQEMTDLADEGGFTIALSPSKDFGGSVPRLKKFYKSMGFVENTGSNKDFRFQETFIREPAGAPPAGVTSEEVESVLAPLKAARATVRQIKTEFSPESIAGRLVGVKRDGVTPLIESSKVFNELMGGQKAPELLERTVASLSKSPAGKKAIGDLQARTIADLLEHAFKAETRKVAGERVFGATAFNKRLTQIGDRRLNALFATRPDVLRKLKQVSQAARDVTPPSGAVPKGSASVILDSLNKLGILSITSKVPGGALMVETIKTMADKSANRKVLEKALDASPNVKRMSTFIANDMPSLAAVLGVSFLADKKEPEK
jgi:GNAT superfamily N-acetyltransferase